MVVVHRKRRLDTEMDLRALFDPGIQFIGRDVSFVVSKAGPSTSFGSMDHGQEVGQWKAGRLLAEVWFESGICIAVEVRPSAK